MNCALRVLFFISGLLLAFSGGIEAQTLYSYQSGSWNSSLVWTTDPSGTLFVNPTNQTPGAGINVVILNGRTVTIPAGSNNRVSNSLELKEGGILNLGLTTGHGFGQVTGMGTIRMEAQTNTFGAGTLFSTFIEAGGGTFELNNSVSRELPTILSTCNNLVINNSATAIEVTLVNNQTIRGDLTILSGTYKINSNTANNSLTINLLGDLLVESAGQIRTGTRNVSGGHDFFIKGDFTNNGNVRFSNLNDYLYQEYPNNGYVHTIFDNGAADQSIQCNNITDFYRIEIAKGTDKTYVLNIDAANSGFFRLLGHNFETPTWTDEATNDNSLGLESGTCRLGRNISIPCLSTGFYYIKEPASLWIDGAQVVFKDASYPTQPTPGTNNCGLYVYGSLKLTGNGSLTLNGFSYRGTVLRGSASVEMLDNTTLVSSLIRTSASGANNRGAFIMRDNAIVTLTGNTYDGTYATFDFGYPDNLVEISGGTLNIQNPNTVGSGSGNRFSLHVASEARNLNVTGGTININIPSDIFINSTMPFWDLNLTGTSTANDVSVRQYTWDNNTSHPRTLTVQPLVVLHNFTIQNRGVLNNANNVDVRVGGNFSIEANAVYTPGNNTTVFDGNGGQSFSNLGTITSGLYNLTLSNQANVSISKDLTVRNQLTINENCFLNDVGYVIGVVGTISNSGTHTSQAGGRINLNGAAAQVIGGSGAGVFGNLVQNNANGISLAANQAITGDLRLAANALFNIGIYNLAFSPGSRIYSAATGTPVAFSAAKMILTSGNESDGGVSKMFDASNTSFTFPFGVTGKYSPAQIQINGTPATFGSITTRPVNKKLAFATSNNLLNYYWKSRSAGFSGIAPNSIRHLYTYAQGDVVPAGTDNTYVAGAYTASGWTSLAPDLSTVDEINNVVLFPTTAGSGIGYIDGDFTAGAPDAFAVVVTFYSRTSANWNLNTTWSTVAVGGPACPAGSTPGVNIPGPTNPVVIGDGVSLNHTVTVPVGFNNISTGNLQINSGSVLDLTTTTGHNFGSVPDAKVTGNGRLKISSTGATAQFPSGDFGLFLDSLGGTVEYYSTASMGANPFTIPATKLDGMPLTTYRNLLLSPAAGKTINMPNANLTIYNDFIINETATTGTAQLSTSNATAYTVYVKGNMLGNAGIFRYPNVAANRPQHLVVDGDISISNGAIMDVISNANDAANSLTVSGNITNNGTLDFKPNTSYCNLIFTGEDNKEVNGTTATRTRLNAVTINKGTSRNSVLDVTVNNTNFSLNTTLPNALTLTNGTFRLTTNTTINLTTGAFTIPTTGCLSANGGTINIGTNDVDASDLYLNGRLEVLNGAVNIGDNGDANNHDIEYASAGVPEIFIAGGNLNVYGQVRRSTLIETGSLNYTQTGGTTNIYGTDAQNARGMFELLNEGSLFQMSGGTLTLIRNFNNPSFNDLYIMPGTSDVTGGTIQLGTGATTASQFNIVLATPVWDLNVDGTSTIKTVNLRVSPLVVLNDLTIGNASGVNSMLVTNGFDVTIGHNLYNYNTNAGTALNTGGYQAINTNQRTVFNGAANQLITGRGTNLTNFANLTIENGSAGISTTLAANSDIRVNGNLSVVEGILADGGNDITVIGDILNEAAHNSSLATGGIFMAGPQKQFISGDGSGEFGNITINNANGVDVRDNTTINGRLTFISGSLYIDDMLLTLGLNASIAGTLDATRMIRVNGALSDLGVRKIYPSGAHSFTFPVGVSGKYTPATLNVTTNTYAGSSSITVKPINSRHPATNELTPVTDELQYYWNVVSSGFSNGVIVNHTYQYINGDALPSETGYVVGRYDNFNWTLPAGSTVNAGADQITINGYNNINGEYTCGINTNFLNLQTFYSRTATAGLPAGASWDLATSWTTVADGSGGAAPYAPNGNPLVILPGHKINAVTPGNKAYSILLQGTLDLGATVNHSHGHVNGNGTLRIGSTTEGYFVFPGGEYDEFMNTPGTTVEFYSTIPATLPNSIGTVYKPYQNLRFTGAGAKYMASVHMKVRGNLDIQEGYLNNALANKNIYLLGNWSDATNNGFVPGKGLVSFEGLTRQHTSITTNENFYDLRINNAAGDSILGSGSNTVTVSRYLYLTSGNICTDANHMLHLTSTSTGAVLGGGTNSFVSGPMRKTISNSSWFNFPVGKTGRYGNVYVSNLNNSGVLEAEYFTGNPFNASSKIAPIDTVTTKEHWTINSPAVVTGNVRIRWDALSDIIPATTVGLTKLRVVEWNGTAWLNRGGMGIGTLTSGTIQTNPVVNLNNNHYFTIGLESLPTANITTGNSSICDDGVDATTILVDLTGTAPWTLKYEINGGDEQTISNIGLSPASIVVNSTSAGMTGPGVYTYNISYISDATGAAGMRDFNKQVTITVEESPNPVITGKNPVSQNEPSVTYSITGGAGHTYAWVVNGGAITAGQGTTQVTVTWGTGATGSVAVTETITATGCAVTATMNITINLAPSPVITGTSSVCSGATQTYQTGAAPTHNFIWNVTGGTIVGGVSSGTGLNSIQVVWGTGAAGSVEVTEEIPVPYGFGTDQMDITINPLPDELLTVTDPTICLGNTASIVVELAEGGMDYTLRLNFDNSTVDFIHTAAAGNVTLEATPAVTTVYNVLAENEYGCSVVITDLSTVTIQPALVVGNITGETSATQCSGYDVAAMTISPTGASGTYNYRWQSSIDNGTTWNTIGGATAASYNPGAITATTWYRAQVDPTGTPDCASWTISDNSVSIEIGPDVSGPIFDLGATSTRCLVAGTVTYSATAANSIGITYSLDATSDAEGNTIDAATGEVTFVDGWGGTTTITASAEGCNGPVTSTHTVTADIPVTSLITGNASPMCIAQDEVYSVDLTTGSTYEWHVPSDATIESGVSGPDNNQITVDFGTQSGEIVVIETNANGCFADTVKLAIELQGCDLVADFSADKTEACPGEVILFTSDSQGVNSGTSYQWNFGEGAVPESVTGIDLQAVTVYYTTSGTKTVSLIISNGVADDTVRTDYITVHEVPSVSLENVYRCGAGEVVFNAVSSDGQQVEFSTDAFGNNIVATDVTGPDFTYTTVIAESSSLQIWARAVNTVTGCSGTWDSSAFAIAHALPQAGAIQTSNTGVNPPADYVDAVCVGEERTYFVNDPSGEYNWRITNWRGNGLDTTVTNSTLIDIRWSVAGGDYTIELVKISAQGCTSLVRDTLVLVSQPIADLGEDVSICEGESHTFELEEGYSSYTWQGTSGTNTFTASTTGEIAVRVMDAYGCIAYDTVMLTVNPNPVIFLGNDTSLCGENYITLDPGEFDSYDWSTNAISRTIEVREGAGNISVTVTDENGCQGYDEIRIGECSMLLKIPNAFTPNEDDAHDEWEIPGIELFSDADIKVFDRWGRVVFSSSGAYSSDPWDGKGPNGKDLPVDTYYYIIDLKVPGGELLNGTVDLIR
ncbi:MAG: gliding motility-associated C-terminal domain-containing protein [Bacteroidales bacterium]